MFKLTRLLSAVALGTLFVALGCEPADPYNPAATDTDGDGVVDAIDAFPDDPDRHEVDPEVRFGAISGSVAYAFREAAEGVLVALQDGRSAITDNLGVFRFDQIAPGMVSVTANTSGYAEAQTELIVWPGAETLVDLTLVPGARVADTPSAEILAVLNDGQEFLMFDNGWTEAHDAPDSPPGRLFVVHRDGSFRRTISDNIYLTRFSQPLLSPKGSFYYVEQEVEQVRRTVVYDLRETGVVGMLPLGCGLVDTVYAEDTIVKTVAKDDMVCFAHASGGDDVHQVAADQVGFKYNFTLYDGSFAYLKQLQQPPSGPHIGFDLVRLDPADLSSSIIARIASIASGPGGSTYIMDWNLDGFFLIARCNTLDNCENNSTLSKVVLPDTITPVAVNNHENHYTPIADGFLLRSGYNNRGFAVYLSLDSGDRTELTTVPEESISDVAGDRAIYFKPSITPDRYDLATTTLQDQQTTLVTDGSISSTGFYSLMCFGPNSNHFALFATPEIGQGVFIGSIDGSSLLHIDAQFDITTKLCGQDQFLALELDDESHVYNAYSMIDGQLVHSFYELGPAPQVFKSFQDGNDWVFIASRGETFGDLYRCTVGVNSGCTLLDSGVSNIESKGKGLRYQIPCTAEVDHDDLELGLCAVWYDYTNDLRTVMPYAIRAPTQYGDSFFGLHRKADDRVLRWFPGTESPTFVLETRLCQPGATTPGFFAFDMRTDYNVRACSYVSVDAETRGSYIAWWAF